MTYHEMCEELSAASEWLSNLGIRDEQDRIRQHIRRIEALEQARQAGRLQDVTTGDDARLAMFSLTEAMEFLDVYAAFGSDRPAGLRQRLRDVLQGPADPAQESPDSNHARNIMFELNLASRLRVHGIPTLLRENPDVLCELRQTPIYIQCKRPYREETIPVNIEGARYQLIRDLNGANVQAARGIIAISVSRVFNPGQQLFVGPDEQTVKRQLGDQVEALGRSHLGTWGNITDPCVIGILFHLITPAHIQDINLLIVAQETIVFTVPNRPQCDVELLRSFKNVIDQN